MADFLGFLIFSGTIIFLFKVLHRPPPVIITREDLKPTRSVKGRRRKSHASDSKWGDLQRKCLDAVRSGDSDLFKASNLSLSIQLIKEKRPCNIIIISIASAWYLEFDEALLTEEQSGKAIKPDWVAMANLSANEGNISESDYHSYLLKGFRSARAAFNRDTLESNALKHFLKTSHAD